MERYFPILHSDRIQSFPFLFDAPAYEWFLTILTYNVGPLALHCTLLHHCVTVCQSQIHSSAQDSSLLYNDNAVLVPIVCLHSVDPIIVSKPGVEKCVKEGWFSGGDIVLCSRHVDNQTWQEELRVECG